MADVDVTLGLNANDLHKELADSKSKLSSFAGALQGLGAGFLAGLGVNQVREAVTSALHYGSTIQDLSERFGVSAETIQRFGNVAEKNGGSLESMAKAFQFLEKNREKALADPTGPVAEHFENANIAISDLESLNADDLMKRVGASSLNAADGVALLGRGFFEVRTSLAQIADFGFDKTPIVSNEDIERVDQFDDALKAVQQTLKAIAVTIIGELIPVSSKMQDNMFRPGEEFVKLFDKTPLGEAAAPEDVALAKQIHDQRERQAGEKLPNELAAAAVIEPVKKQKRQFGEADNEEGTDKEVKGKEDRGLLKGELDVIGADLEAKEETQKDARAADERSDKEARDKEAREEKAGQKLRKLDSDFEKNPANLSLHDYATKGAGVFGAKAREAESEEALAKQLQLQGNLGLAAQHQSRAEQLKKELGLPSKEDQKDAVKNGLDESENIRAIRKNTEDITANK